MLNREKNLRSNDIYVKMKKYKNIFIHTDIFKINLQTYKTFYQQLDIITNMFDVSWFVSVS